MGEKLHRINDLVINEMSIDDLFVVKARILASIEILKESLRREHIGIILKDCMMQWRTICLL